MLPSARCLGDAGIDNPPLNEFIYFMAPRGDSAFGILTKSIQRSGISSPMVASELAKNAEPWVKPWRFRKTRFRFDSLTSSLNKLEPTLTWNADLMQDAESGMPAHHVSAMTVSRKRFAPDDRTAFYRFVKC